MADFNPYHPPRLPAATAEGISVAKILFSFRGRIPRSTYWIFSLPVNAAILVLLDQLSSLGGIYNPPPSNSALPELPPAPAGNPGPWIAAAILATYLPLLWIKLAVLTKRWHDQNRSANWLLLTFIPVVGAVINFIECALTRGTRGDNRYGPDPIPDPLLRPLSPPRGPPAPASRRAASPHALPSEPAVGSHQKLSPKELL